MPREHPVLARPATLQLADMPTFQGYFVPGYRQAEFQQLARYRVRRRLRVEKPAVPKGRQMLLPQDTGREDDTSPL